MKDRTNEFLETVGSLKRRQTSMSSAGQTADRPMRARTTFGLHFNDVSRRVHHAVTETQRLLETLQTLVKGRGLYDDNPQEVNGLTQIIKQNIPKHQREVATLKEIVAQGGGSGEKHHKAHAQAVVMDLTRRLAETSKRFKGVLELRTQALKKSRERREQFSFGGTAYNPLADEMPTLFGELGGDDDTSLSIPGGASEQQVALIQNDQYIEERAAAMQSIETAIVEVQEVFGQLANVIHEQGESVERIDDNVQSAVDNVESAQRQLEVALKSVSSNKWLMMKVFGILLLFFVLFVVVFA